MTYWLIERQAGALHLLSQQKGYHCLPDTAWPRDSWRPSPVRILGTVSNAPVIYHLLQQGCRVELGTPQLVTSVTAREPERVLWAMQTVADNWLGPAKGGWHVATRLDEQTYGLWNPEQQAELWRQHPLREVLQLIPHLDLEVLRQLVAEIRDPRWYIDPNHPARGSRLTAYALGTVGCRPTRARLVRTAWRTERLLPATANFLWREWHKVRQTKTDEMASRYVDRKLLVFLRHIWLATVQAPAYPRLFEPAYFFEGPALQEFLFGVRQLRYFEWCVGA